MQTRMDAARMDATRMDVTWMDVARMDVARMARPWCSVRHANISCKRETFSVLVGEDQGAAA